ncbi:MAG: asparagine synthase (glutamine-hydrolyzing) [Thermodesulfobacteriota bacterium]
MCGIAGALVFEGSNFEISESYLVRMRDAMVHRGPDGAGVWVGEHGRVGLAHRRLSIIDLTEDAAQPMSSIDGTRWLSFNGEIYNHAEIRAELTALGHDRWKTDHSDTEVILHSFEEWGIDCVHRFRGMFAFALWDCRTRELWLVRDRIGIKPLYYAIHHGRITFASEIKALLQDPEQERVINEESLFHFLSFYSTPPPLTLFDGIRKLPGGTYVRVSPQGHMREQRYWEVWDHVAPLADKSDDELAERVLHELRAAVRYRKVSDVPVGVFLSGGIDSSTNAALFSEDDPNPISTFSVGFAGHNPSYPNEVGFARGMAETVGARHHQRLLTLEESIAFLPRMVLLQDEPIADPACVPIYYLSKLARDNGVVVCQVGEGADELFYGYPAWKQALDLQRWGDLPLVPWLMRELGSPLARLLGKGDGLPNRWMTRASRREPVFWGAAEAFSDAEKLALFTPGLRKRFARYSSWEAVKPVRDRFEQHAWDTSPLHWMTYLDLNFRLPELILMRIDKMTMAVALEARVPFLDHKLVELMLSIPAQTKIRGGMLKYLLRKAVRGLVPEAVLSRPKQGLGVPLQEWIAGGLSTAMRNAFRDAGDGVFDRTSLLKLLDHRDPLRPWMVFNFCQWCTQYDIRSSA